MNRAILVFYFTFPNSLISTIFLRPISPRQRGKMKASSIFRIHRTRQGKKMGITGAAVPIIAALHRLRPSASAHGSLPSVRRCGYMYAEAARGRSSMAGILGLFRYLLETEPYPNIQFIPPHPFSSIASSLLSHSSFSDPDRSAATLDLFQSTK